MDGLLLAIAVFVVLVIFGVWFAFALVRYRGNCPRPTWDGVAVWWTMRLYARVVQRTHVEGRDHLIEAQESPEPIILVANHTGAADPIVIQAACPFEIRWMMMRRMHKGIAVLAARYGRIILVEQDGRDFAGMRQALRHLKTGGAIGLFPEGGIARPPGTLRPFQTGVGFLVRKSKAIVLPVWLDGMPPVDIAVTSLYRRGFARVHFGGPMRFEDGLSPEAITNQIRAAIAGMSRWPDTPQVEDSQALG